MKYLNRIICVAAVLFCSSASAIGTSAVKYLEKDATWFQSDEAKQIATNILSYQTKLGGWPKNIDTAVKPYDGDLEKLEATYDNKATTDELRYLARIYNATKDEKYHDAFNRGLTYILDNQYANGGWPQEAPPRAGYGKYITFNDGAMARLMFFIREVYNTDVYAFVDGATRDRAKKAWDTGIECILKCQIKVDGKLTAWCAQHDEVDFSPRPARAFELASLSGCETIGIVHVLMNVENPSPEVIAAVDATYEWLNAVKITGIREEDRPQAGTPKGYERYIVQDPAAPPIWARFYEIGTNKPIFSDRDSVKKYSLAEIGIERRTGYHWYGYWPKNFLATEYATWKAKVSGGK